jgi:toxin ParE1/3/4
MGYRTTRRADRDVIDLYVQGARSFGAAQAERYSAGLFDLFGLLAAAPLIARKRTELVRPVRLHPYRAHVVAYVEHGPDILIVRVLHRQQDPIRHL